GRDAIASLLLGSSHGRAVARSLGVRRLVIELRFCCKNHPSSWHDSIVLYTVYVIELVGMPGQRAGETRLYVGQSAKTPEQRFAQHKAGGSFSSPNVRKYGQRLVPRLYA